MHSLLGLGQLANQMGCHENQFPWGMYGPAVTVELDGGKGGAQGPHDHHCRQTPTHNREVVPLLAVTRRGMRWN